MPKIARPPRNDNKDLLMRVLATTPVERWTFVIGNGLTLSFLDKSTQDTIAWGNILKNWLAKPAISRQLSSDVMQKVRDMIETGQSDLLLEAADLILYRGGRKMMRKLLEASFASLTDHVQMKCTCDSCWGCFLQHLHLQSRNGKIRPPMLVTTNFDHVVAKVMGISLRCWPLDPKKSTPQAWRDSLNDALLSTGFPPVPAHLRRLMEMRYLDDLRRKGLMGPDDDCVYHIHGWWKMPESIVFDVMTYERSLENTDIERRLLDLAPRGNNSVMILVGMGESMNDRRFKALWQKTRTFKKRSEARIFWIVSDEKKYVPEVPELADGRKVIKVAMPFGEHPRLLRTALEKHSHI